jgi:predicted lysophospholipase L1 biosynthesis ABC-type transport system permease subunit
MLFSIGLVLGGTVSALVLYLASGLATPAPEPARYGVIVALAAAGVLRDAGVVRFPLPQNARQVPQEVLNRNVARGSLRFGFELGTGVRTYVSATVPYVMAAALLLSAPDLLTATLTGAGFGLGRALTPLARHTSPSGEAWDAQLRGHLKTITTGGGVIALASLALLLFAHSWALL